MGKGEDTAKVSVVMPAYNHAKWVGQAIRSVLQQSFRDLELMVIDDASSDTTWEVVQKLFADTRDARLLPARHDQNQGAPATLNEGLQRARGEYLAILNSDDIWEPNRLARLVDYFERHPADFVGTDMVVLDANSIPKESSEPHWVTWFEELKRDYAGHGDIFATLLRGNFLISTSNFFFRRSVYQGVGGFSELRYVHDYDYALRVLASGFKLEFLPEKLLGYRLHGSNTIRDHPLAANDEDMRLLLAWLPKLHGMLDVRRQESLAAHLEDVYRYSREGWMTKIHEELQEKERVLFELIDDRDRWIAERDQWITDRDHVIQALQQKNADLESWVADRDRWIADREHWIAERDGVIEQQARMLAERDGWVADRDRWIGERDLWLQERDALIDQLRQQQQALLTSRSYRLGKALLSPAHWWRRYQ
jgi:glycosyltransferase involved in cell wall biosynthesis